MDAYLNRFHQLAILPEQFSEDEIHDIEYNDDLTKIQFQMTIGEQNKEDTVILKIALNYETDEIKPKPSAVKFKLTGSGKDQYGDEARNELKDQCSAFCSYPIAVAVRQAFL